MPHAPYSVSWDVLRNKSEKKNSYFSDYDLHFYFFCVKLLQHILCSRNFTVKKYVLIDNRYISANVSETDQVEIYVCVKIR